MKKSYTSILVSAGMLLSAPLFTTAVAAEDEEKTNIVRSFVFQINKGEMTEFREGFEAYWACYKENGGKDSWSAWTPQSGNLDVVAFRSPSMGWSAFDDTDDEAGKACESTFEEKVEAHWSSISSDFYATWDDVSQVGDGEINVVRVNSFDVHDVGNAHDLIKDYMAPPAVEGAPGIVFQGHITKNDRWDLSIAFLFENFAQMNPAGGPSFDERQIAHHGKEKFEQMEKDWDKNVKSVSSSIWQRSKSMSYSPAE